MSELTLDDMVGQIEREFRAVVAADQSAIYPAEVPEDVTPRQKFVDCSVGDAPVPEDFPLRYARPAGRALATVCLNNGLRNMSPLRGGFAFDPENGRILRVLVSAW